MDRAGTDNGGHLLLGFLWKRPALHVRLAETIKGALIGVLLILLAGCAAPHPERRLKSSEPDWGQIAKHIGNNSRR